MSYLSMQQSLSGEHAFLSGEQAFYIQPDYLKVTKEEMASAEPLNNPAYIFNTESKIWRVVKEILSVIIFPIGLYKLLHSLAGKFIVMASLNATADQRRKAIYLRDNEWKMKRISIEMDGYTIDAAILGKVQTLGNGRWVLYSNGNGEFYEDKLVDYFNCQILDSSFKNILTELKGNAVVFNYPGVGASTGMPNRNAMAKAYRAMLNFLEDQEKGIGAKEIIGYGHSLGGGVQSDALNSHVLKQGIKYVFIKSRTFSDLSSTVSHITSSVVSHVTNSVVSHLTGRLVGLLVKVFGWNMESVESSKKLNAPEIIMQTRSVPQNTFFSESLYTDISEQPEQIVHDGVIPAEVSLAKKLLEDKQQLAGNKFFMGIPDKHNDGLEIPATLVAKINEMLKN